MSGVDALSTMYFCDYRDGWTDLAAAIIAQACRDYTKLMDKHLKNPKDVYYKNKMKDIEHFFHSEWYKMLTDIDPDRLIKRLKESRISARNPR